MDYTDTSKLNASGSFNPSDILSSFNGISTMIELNQQIKTTMVPGNSTEHPGNSTSIDSTDNFTPVADEELGGHSLAEIVFIAIVAVILMFLTIGGNMLVIIAYRKNRRLRSVNNLFLVSLACSDLVIGIVSMTLYPVFMITETWYLGEVACDIWLCIDYTLSMASVANLMLICLDRYFSVTRPFTYRRKRTRNKAKIAIVSAWIFSMLLWSPAILIWPRVRERTVAPDDCRIQFFEDPVITSVTAILAFYLPVIVMIILYWRIYLETRRCHQYLEYLKSYKITQAGARSPAFRRRPSSTPQLSPVRSISNHLFTPRRRVNSTPAGGVQSTRGKSWRNHSSGRPHSNSVSDRKSLMRLKQERLIDPSPLPVPAVNGDSLSPSSSRLQQATNNNNVNVKCDSPQLSYFQRLKRTVVSTILRKSENATQGDPLDEHKGGRRETESSCCEHSQGHCPSAGTSIANSPSPVEKRDHCVLMVNGETVEPCGTPTMQRKDEIISVNRSQSKNSVGAVPIIVTLEDAEEPRTPLLVRRTTSEGASFQRGASLAVPGQLPNQEPPPSPSSVKVPSSERKAARTLSAILVAFIVTWLPYNVCVIYSSFCEVNECQAIVPTAVWEFAYYLCYINSTVNPFCFALCNKTFRDTFVRILTCSGRSRRPETCCWRRRKLRDRNLEVFTTQPSTSSSRSAPPSPYYVKRAKP